jgi:hypothetical protein
MTTLAMVIAWKLPETRFTCSDDGNGYANILEEFDGEIPSQALQDTWTAEYDAYVLANDYKDKRLAEYPKIEELVVALYDTDDKAAIEKRRSDVKAKYPKPS